jgi:hypothetical protein
MKTALKLDLEKYMERWMEKNCQSIDWIDVYVYEDLIKDMAFAAEMVFDANYKGQKFAEEQ